MPGPIGKDGEGGKASSGAGNGTRRPSFFRSMLRQPSEKPTPESPDVTIAGSASPPPTSPPSPVPRKRSVREQASALQLSRAPSFLVSTTSILGLAKEYGQDEAFTKQWIDWSRWGVIISLRQAFSFDRRPRHDRSKPKTTQFHIKTSKKGPYKGHLPIPDNWVYSSGIKVLDEVQKNKYIDEYGSIHEVYVTYERQDLRFIQNQVLAGVYKLKDLKPKTEPFTNVNLYFTSLTREGEKEFCITVNSEPGVLEKQEGALITNVKVLAGIFERQAAGVEQNALNAAAKKLFESSLWKDNLNKTVKVIELKNGKPIGPHIASDENGIPIKGDIDQRNFIISSDLLLTWGSNGERSSLDLIELNANDPDLILKLINQLSELNNELAKIDNELKTVVAQAISNLKTYLYVDGIGKPEKKFSSVEKKNEFVTMMGNIELLNAAIVLGLNGDLEHGSDGVSPILPEPYGAEHFPSIDGTKIYETYGEYDYLMFVFLNESMFENRIINFNTCEFATTKWKDKDGNYKMRSDDVIEVVDHHRVVRKFSNREDEENSIQLRSLIFERQLLQLRAKGEVFYDTYSKAEARKFDTLLERAAKSGQNEVVEALAYGKLEKDKIIESVSLHKDKDSIIKRLQEISDISNRIIDKQSPTISRSTSPRSAISDGRSTISSPKASTVPLTRVPSSPMLQQFQIVHMQAAFDQSVSKLKAEVITDYLKRDQELQAKQKAITSRIDKNAKPDSKRPPTR